MSSDLIVVGSHDAVATAARLMLETGLRSLPVARRCEGGSEPTPVRIAGHARTKAWAATEWPRFKEIVRSLPEVSGLVTVGA